MVAPRPRHVLVLASGSQGRLRLLREAGIRTEAVASGVDEAVDAELDTPAAVQVLAERKASAVAALRPGALVLGCDSLLDRSGASFGKPGSAEEAIAMWSDLSGHEATLYTGHCLIDGNNGRRLSGLARTTVRFGVPDDSELAAYVATGEPLVMAGAFSIDGRCAPFINGIDGDPGTVIGVSMPLVRRMLGELGIAITDLWENRATA